ncbi:MAG TPA: hypothetical protein VGK06_14950 [Methanosarcina sp.]
MLRWCNSVVLVFKKDYKAIKGDSEDERSNPGDFSQTRFAWVFVKQRQIYYSRRNTPAEMEIMESLGVVRATKI